MLMDGRTIPAGTSLNADICIVGTGMGAISTANDLVRAGRDVLLIEAGALTSSNGRAPPIETEIVGHPFRLTTSRGLEVGGSTVYWHGLCAELDDSDFEKRDWIPHSGWPIDRSDLSIYYERAWDFLCGGNRIALAKSTLEARSYALAPGTMDRKAYQYHAPRSGLNPLSWIGVRRD